MLAYACACVCLCLLVVFACACLSLLVFACVCWCLLVRACAALVLACADLLKMPAGFVVSMLAWVCVFSYVVCVCLCLYVFVCVYLCCVVVFCSFVSAQESFAREPGWRFTARCTCSRWAAIFDF